MALRRVVRLEGHKQAAEVLVAERVALDFGLDTEAEQVFADSVEQVLKQARVDRKTCHVSLE